MTTGYVEKIMASTDSPQQLDALVSATQKEKAHRHDFRQWITPSIKAEFINGEVILHSPFKKRHFDATYLLSSLLSIYVRVKKLGCIAT